MSRNSMSETGQAEDMIRSFVQFGSAEIHAKGLYEKATAELENGYVNVEDNEVLQKHLDKCEQYRLDIETYANLRRSVMRKLFSMFDGDKDAWCLVKHLGIGAMTLFEAYEAIVLAMTRFLGVEISDCAACLSDSLKGER